MSVLVDTSCGFDSRRIAHHSDRVDGLLSRDEVSGHEFFYGELLVGDGDRRKELLANYERITHAPFVAHPEVVTFVRDRKLNGRGIGRIDAHLLASALVGRLKLWTAGSPLATVAAELGIAYE